MFKSYKFIITLCICLSFTDLFAQKKYAYSLDLNQTASDSFHVTLKVPMLNRKELTFSFAALIPGTYSRSDYGKFVSDVRAYDRSGKMLPVSKTDINDWQISSADKLDRITYSVDDVFDTRADHSVYPMAATNIEAGKSIVLNTPGVFGFFKGFNDLPFSVVINKPVDMYASTALTPVNRSKTEDVFNVKNVDELFDSPIMYTVPDTTMLQVANTKILISVYAPSGNIKAQTIAEWMKDLLTAASKYLGGKLPADKYAFIYYFKDTSLVHSFGPGAGALEHPSSSFYYLYDLPTHENKKFIADISSHEFFHIITPLTLASEQVKKFNFHEPVMSKHLWLYEGVTEYTSHHVQVKHGLNTPQEFLDKLSGKIRTSRSFYNDTLPFTELSSHSAGKHNNQFGNVYQKGALIAACLDLLLLNNSRGKSGLRELIKQLSATYGKDRFFKDEDFFSKIALLTTPAATDFLSKYVASGDTIPYADFFRMAGVELIPAGISKKPSLGGFNTVPGKNGGVTVGAQSKLNNFGAALGLEIGDEIKKINDVVVTPNNFGAVSTMLRGQLKPGDTITMVVERSSATAELRTLTLKTNYFLADVQEQYILKQSEQMTDQQRKINAAWLQPDK